MAKKTPKQVELNVPIITAEGEVVVMTLRIAYCEEGWRILHVMGRQGRNTDTNSTIRAAWRAANVYMPTNLIAQIGDLQQISKTNVQNCQLALAIGIALLSNQIKIPGIEKCLIAGTLDIAGNIYPPKGIDAALFDKVASDAGLKSFGCKASGAQATIDTLVGLVP